jgi:hypothetical protein
VGFAWGVCMHAGEEGGACGRGRRVLVAWWRPPSACMRGAESGFARAPTSKPFCRPSSRPSWRPAARPSLSGGGVGVQGGKGEGGRREECSGAAGAGVCYCFAGGERCAGGHEPHLRPASWPSSMCCSSRLSSESKGSALMLLGRQWQKKPVLCAVSRTREFVETVHNRMFGFRHANKKATKATEVSQDRLSCDLQSLHLALFLTCVAHRRAAADARNLHLIG